MFRLIVLTCVVAAACGRPQLVKEQDAKIIKEQRFNAGDGRAGSAFATENEIVFREETALDGSRIGQYSYIGDDGQTYTVKYSAGKEGFRILEGSHIPSGGQDAAAFVSENPDDTLPPLQQQQPIRQQPQQVAPRARPAPQQVRFQPAPQPIRAQEEDRNPFINPHDPTHLNFAHNKNGAKFAPKVAGVLDGSFVPPCAGCEGLNPFVNPFDQSHQNAGFLAGQLAGVQAQQPARRPLPIANARPTGRVVSQPQQPAFQTQQALLNTLPQQQQQAAAPQRVFPPGQIQLNRFETGFNFDFQS
jgi:hypothetical protein